jgi:hypothetical protein
MKKGLVFLACVFMLMACVSQPRAAGMKFVQINNPLVNIYEFLDPKSNIIKVAKKGDHFELVFEGTSWYQVKVSDKVGWLDKKYGAVVDNPNPSYLGTFIVFTILLVGTLAGVSYYIYKQKTSEA